MVMGCLLSVVIDIINVLFTKDTDYLDSNSDLARPD
jgi:hypothetical protein